MVGRRTVLGATISVLLLACSSSSSSSGDSGSPEDGAAADSGASGSDSGSSFDASNFDTGLSISNDTGGALYVGNDGGTVSFACYIAGQNRCHEYPEATNDQIANIAVECSSTSGVLSMPAACPTAGFLGKCTIGSGAGADVTRWYAPADATYEMSYCASPVNGVWSTTF